MDTVEQYNCFVPAEHGPSLIPRTYGPPVDENKKQYCTLITNRVLKHGHNVPISAARSRKTHKTRLT